jgi:hypothetical protein
VRATEPSDGAEVSRLFAPPVRWGHEYVAPVPPAESPERGNPPTRRQVRTVPRAQAAGLRDAAVLAAIGAVGALILDSALGLFQTGGAKGETMLVVLVHLAAAAVAFRVARAWQRSSSTGASAAGTSAAVRRNLLPAANALVTFLAPYIVLPIEAWRLWRRVWRGRHDLVPHPGDAKRAEAEYERSKSAWQERIAQFEAAEAKRFEAANVWRPVPVSETAPMTCVFGGTSISWTAALVTLGASLLGSGARVVIGDLSRRVTADVLCDLCRTAGVPTTEAVLPGSPASADLFADISWSDLSTVLVEVLHSAQQDLDASRRERQEDRSVIREVAGCLESARPISIARLRRAMLVVQGAHPADGDGVITVGEHSNLVGLFNEVQRQHGGLMERVIRIERALRDFEVLDGSSGVSTAPVAPGDRRTAQRLSGAVEHRGVLRVIAVDKHADELENERLIDLLFQLLLRRVRQGRADADLLIILGADRVRREALESLMAHAEHGRLRVLLFFEHLRQDAIEIVGGGGAAAAFLALGNHREAREASGFIGAEYKWVESQHTASAGESLTRSSSREKSTSTSGIVAMPSGLSLGRAKTKGRSYSEAFGESSEYAVGDERVREAVIEPEVLMGLPATGMIYVEVLPGGRRIATNVDCHPHIVLRA